RLLRGLTGASDLAKKSAKSISIKKIKKKTASAAGRKKTPAKPASGSSRAAAKKATKKAAKNAAKKSAKKAAKKAVKKKAAKAGPTASKKVVKKAATATTAPAKAVAKKPVAKKPPAKKTPPKPAASKKVTPAQPATPEPPPRTHLSRQEVPIGLDPSTVLGQPPTIKQLKKIKTGLSRKAVNQLKAQLLEKKAELLGDVRSMEAARAAANSGDLSHMPLHMADVGSDAYDQEFTLGLMESDRRLLGEIDEALARMRDGYFGVCLESAEPIEEIRLEIKPWAKYCIAIARQREKRGLRN
ncbi:MAG: TraR/DksA family transcriptional regulator, partial [Planctomycetota bacterium]